jgi:hypothetical protein
MTPKYRSAYTESQSVNTLARMYLNSTLIRNITSYYKKNSADSNFDIDPAEILNRLHQHATGSQGPYLQFILEAAVESCVYKFQVKKTQGDSYVIFGIGKKPRMFSFRGSLLNCEEYDWRIQMMYLFEKYISISRLARFKSAGPNFVTIAYDSMMVSGALLNLQTSMAAQQELVSPFSFTMIAPQIRTLRSKPTGRSIAAYNTPTAVSDRRAIATAEGEVQDLQAQQQFTNFSNNGDSSPVPPYTPAPASVLELNWASKGQTDEDSFSNNSLIT